jgi:mono/diheme cytochrome c family protein
MTFQTLLAASSAFVLIACGNGDDKKDASVKLDARVDTAITTTDSSMSADRAPDTTTGDGGPRDVGDAVAAEGGAGDRPDGGGGDGGNAAAVARGKYLVDHVGVCADCHTPRTPMGVPIMAQYLAGAECFIKLPNGSCLHTRNLTNHATGLANRSPDEIKKMFLDGIRPAATGDVALSPVMPYWVFHNMTTADADAIVAYLRTVPGVDHNVPKSGMEFDVPMHANYLDLATIPVPADTYVNKPAAMRGRYLATQAGVCLECHTKRNAPPSLDVVSPANFFAGGEEFPLGLPVTPVSKNLTSDPATGLGNWSLEDIRHVLRDGMDRNDQGICPPMPVGPMGAFGGLTASDMTDIAHYIKSLPAKSNMIVDMCTFPFPAPPPPDGGADAPGVDGGVTDAAATD